MAVLLMILRSPLFALIGATSTTFVFINKCRETIYPGVLTPPGRPPFPTTGLELRPGASKPYPNVPAAWSGRIWARRRCSTDASGRFSCASGDCGTGQVTCNGRGNAPPATLAEFTLGEGGGGADFYDISNVDGFNLPVMINPFGGVVACATVACGADINAACPAKLAARAAPDGRAVGCKSACLAFGKDDFCCRGAYGSPETCRPSGYAMFFKRKCPQAYSYAFDDKSSTFTCHGRPNYNIIFCPYN